MKMKRLLSLLLVFALCFSLVACGTTKVVNTPSPSASDKAPADTTTPSKDPVVVDIFQFKVEFKDSFENAAKAFTAANPNITVNIETVGGGADYGAALKTKFNSGSEPAVFNIGGPQDVADWKAKLADISSTNIAKNVLDGLLTGVTVDGKVFGLPYNIEGYGLIYNKAIFEKAGIDPKSIKSFKALEDAVKTLNSKKADLGIEAVFALPAKETWVTGLHLSNLYFSPEFDGDVLKTFTAKSIEFKYADAMKAMVDLQNNYSAQPTASLDYSTQVEKLFAGGKVAMIQQGNWAYGSVEGVNADLAKNIGFLPYPVPGFKEDSNPIGVPMYWAINNAKSPEVQEAAVKFLDWLYLSQDGMKIVMEQFKFIPAYKGYPTDAVSDPLGSDLLAQANAGKSFNWVFMGYPTDWGMGKLGADIQLYVSNKLSWDDLVKNAKDSWAEARK